MGKLVRVVKVGGALMISIPRGLCRELGIARRSYVHIERGEGRTFVAHPVEVHHVDSLDRRRRPARAGPSP